MASTITIPTQGTVDAEVITLATQAKADVDSLLSRFSAAAGASLTDASSQTIQIAGGSWRKLPTLSQNGTLTLGTTGAVDGDQIEITRTSVSAFTYTVVNGGAGAGTLYTMSAGVVDFAKFQFDGTNWSLRSFGAGALHTVSNAAALSAVDTASLKDNAIVMVETFLQPFQLDKLSAATVDGVATVATLSGTGRWLRLAIPVQHWTNQQNWDLDSATGNDENSGLAGSGFPVKTMIEINRRLRRVNGNSTYTVNVAAAGMSSSNDAIKFNGDQDSSVAAAQTVLLLKGVTTNAVTGTITSCSAPVPATNTGGVFADTSVTLSSYIGHIITMTSGVANGAVAVIAKDLGGSAVRVHDFYMPTTGAIAAGFPSPGDTYVIKTLPVVTAFNGGQGLRPRSRIVCQDLTLSGNNQANAVGDMLFFGCRITGSFQHFNHQLYFTQFYGCSFHLSVLGVLVNIRTPQAVDFFGCTLINCIVEVSNNASLNIKSLWQNSYIRQPSGNVLIAGGQINIGGPNAMFDWPAGVPAIGLKKMARMMIQSSAGATGLYGSSATGTYGVEVTEGSTVLVHTSCTPTITGPSGDFQLDGATTALQSLDVSTQYGTGTLVAGVSAAITANVSASSKILITASNVGASTAVGRLEAPTADRVNGPTGSFVVRSRKADATAETNDVSTFDWEVMPSLLTLTTWATLAASPFSRNATGIKTGARFLSMA